MDEITRFDQYVQGLFQYTGGIIEEFAGEPEEKAHMAVARLSEAWLEHCLDGRSYDFYRAKPLLRAAAVLLKARADSLRQALTGSGEDLKSGNIVSVLERYEEAARTITGLTESLGKGV